MFAAVSLVINSRNNVPIIPRSSVISTYGSWIVFVVRPDDTATRRVKEQPEGRAGTGRLQTTRGPQAADKSPQGAAARAAGQPR
jgi:hypothetical protein